MTSPVRSRDDEYKRARSAIITLLEDQDEALPLSDVLETLCPTRPFDEVALSAALSELLTSGRVILTETRRVVLLP